MMLSEFECVRSVCEHEHALSKASKHTHTHTHMHSEFNTLHIIMLEHGHDVFSYVCVEMKSTHSIS